MMNFKLPALFAVTTFGVMTTITMIVSATPAQAGTAAYFGVCSFRDRGNNNGGNVARMPCYAVEGANMSGGFFHIRWKDGVKTQLNAKPGKAFKDVVTGRAYQRVGKYTFVADADGDVIVMDDAEYTDSRYNVNDPALGKLLQNR